MGAELPIVRRGLAPLRSQVTPVATYKRYETKAGKKWLVQYRTPDHRPTTKRGFANKRDAERWFATIEVDMMKGAYVAPSRGLVSVQAVYEEWLTTLVVSANTLATRKSTWANHVEPRWASTNIGDVTVAAVETWVQKMRSAGVGVPTMENAVGVLRMVCKHAVKTRRIIANPAEDIRLPKRAHTTRNYLTHDQVALLVEELTEGATMVRFLAYTGLRWGEMAGLRVGDFNMLRRTIDVHTSITDGEETGMTKNGGRRTVPLPKFLADDVSKLMAGKGRNSLVFTTGEGTRMDNNNYRKRAFTAAVKRCGDQDLTFPTGLTLHDLRHTAASLAVSVGANPLVVQRMLGHKSAAMTLDVYSDLFDTDLHTVADALDAVVSRRASGE